MSRWLRATLWLVCLAVVVAADEAPKQNVTIVMAKEVPNEPRISRDSYLEAYATIRGGMKGAVPATQKKMTDREASYPSDNFHDQGIIEESIGHDYHPKGINQGPSGPYPPSQPANNYGPPSGPPPSGPGPLPSGPQPGPFGGGSPPHPGSGVHYGPPPAPGPMYLPSAGPAPGPPNYGPPMHPGPLYGPPAASHGPVYGPPAPVYGPPAPVYGPGYEMPHAMLGFLDKLKMKLDVFTVLKIILKLIIFKKIIKFIAILCLLLFIPHFKPSEDKVMHVSHDEEMMRSLPGQSQADERLNTLTTFALEAFDAYTSQENSQRSNSDCGSVFCRAQRVLKNVDKKYSFKKLHNLYSSETTPKSTS